MRNRRVRELIVLASLAVAPSLAIADAPPKLSEDVVYTKAGEQELKLDIVAPAEGDGPFPAVMVIHGGGWRGGNKKDVRAVMNECAKRGYVAISPQYRFCPKEIFPAQLHDVKAAVRWVREHSKEQKIDAERLGAMGFSAGGHLALMLGVTGPDDGLEGDGVSKDAPNTRVQAVVNFFGPADLAATDIPTISKPLLKDFIGGTPAEKPELTKKASPITYVSKDDPPMLTFQGTKDPLVPHTQATRLADVMTAAGTHGRVELLLGAGHGWGGDDLKHTTDVTFAFFGKHLKQKN